MKKYIAKSNGETLIEHTNNLLDEFNLLKITYPQIFNDSSWKLLQLACVYHDMGKINQRFQQKVLTNRSYDKLEIPHGLLSITMIPFKELRKKYGFNRKQLKVLAYAIAWHHERDFSKVDEQHYQDEINAMVPEEENFDISTLNIDVPLQKPKKVSERYYTLGNRWLINDDIASSKERQIENYHYFQLFVKVKGLLNRIDYAASGHYQVESSPRVNLSQNILENWQQKNSMASWNELQKWTYNHRNENIVVIGQTGEGKTEGALRWLANEKAFYVLPLKSAINAIYNRIADTVFSGDLLQINNSLALLHSDMMAKALDNEKDADYEAFEQLVNEERQWSKQLSIATLDQIFPFVYHYKSYEPSLATLSYSKVVIDEIQMYTPDLLAYIIYGLKQIQKYGGKFEIMTATLAPFIVDLMKETNLNFVQPDHPFLDPNVNHRHKVQVIHADLTVDDILKLNRNGKTLVICNTVNKAVELYQDLRERNIDAHLIHSRFIRHDRDVKEKEISVFGKSDNHKSGIWIGTQVVEASLDIDFDLLITELSELNGLFQRMGRCYRRRNYKGKKPNVYVFDGGEHAPHGIRKGNKSVVDWQMFEISKQAIVNISGYLSEQDKLDLINKNYTSDKVSDFVNQVKDDMAYLHATENLRPDKSKIKQIFRNIQNIDVIPEEVYLKNKDEINDNLNILRNRKIIPDKKKLIEARENLKDWLVSVPSYLIKNNADFVKNKQMKGLGFYLLSKEYHYDSETGLSFNRIESKSDEDDNFF